MSLLPVVPIALPLAAAGLSMLARRSVRLQQRLGVAASLALLAAAAALLRRVDRDGIIAVQIGGWEAPLGITLVADRFGAVMVLLAAIIGAATFAYSLRTVDHARQSFFYYPLLHVLLMGVCGAFLTGDIFNLYVWFEVLLMSSFVLLALGGERGQLEGAIKYVTLNLISSAFFLSAVGILYGTTGTLNMADLAGRLRDAPPGVATTIAMLFLVAFGIKSGAFPLFFWLPASYHTPPFAVSAIFAGLLTKVGVYAIIRVFTLIFTHDTAFTHGILLAVAAATMVVGVLGAASQGEVRRILSFHIISQIGYMLLGLALYTPLALAGSVFYILHHILVKANLFFIAGVLHRLRGTSRLDHARAPSVYDSAPLVAVLFLIPAMSLAGIPPLSGFFAKFILVRAGLAIGEYWVVAVALLVGLLTLFSMMKIWAGAFWGGTALPGATALQGRGEDTASPAAAPPSVLLPIAALALLSVLIGLFAQPVFALSERAAAQLMDPDQYVRAVLGARAPEARP